jgi:hypothetical protein
VLPGAHALRVAHAAAHALRVLPRETPSNTSEQAGSPCQRRLARGLFAQQEVEIAGDLA